MQNSEEIYEPRWWMEGMRKAGFEHFHTVHFIDDSEVPLVNRVMDRLMYGPTGYSCQDCDLFDKSPKYKICKQHKKRAKMSAGLYGIKYECHHNPEPTTIHEVK